MSQEVIRLRQVNKSFGKHHVLKDVDLSVPEGSVFAFLGNNGEGKSTTIRLLTGLLRADSGEVSVLGKNLAAHGMAIKSQLGCIVDSPTLYPQLTAAEFLSIGCTLKQLVKSEIDRVLKQVDMMQAKHRRIANYSLGMKQRLALAHALLGQPKLLILDEPTNGLDPHGMLEIRDLIKRLPSKTGCTVFVSSHMLDEVEKVASHVALLKGGRILCQSSLSQVIASQDGKLKLEVCDAKYAGQLLENHGYQMHIADNRNLVIQSIAKNDIRQVNKQLIASGIDLFQSVYHKPSLEEWFLQSTQYA